MESNYEITLLNVMTNKRETIHLCSITIEDLGNWLITLKDSNKYTILEIKNKIIINY